MKNWIIMLVGMGFLSSCASLRGTKPVGLEGLNSQATILAVSLELLAEGDPGQIKHCLLQVRRTGELKPIYQSINWDDDVLAFEVKPGEYKLEALDCGRRGSWQFGPTVKRAFTVRPGLVQWYGKLYVEYNAEKDSLKTRWANRDDLRAAAIALLERVPEAQRERVVSVFTGRTVSLETLRSRSSTQRQISIEKHDSFGELDTDQLTTRFASCDRSETARNPIHLGRLEYVATYAGSSLRELKQVKADHTFSEDFVDCVEKALKQFRPVKVKSEKLIEYKVIL